MIECTDREIQDRLPDLLHGTVPEAERARVEAHVAACEPCRHELSVLRSVQGAAVFTPSIDVQSIVRRIPPYQMVLPSVERPVRSPMLRWLSVAALALVAVGGGSVLWRQGETVNRPVPPSAPVAHSLALASGVDELSDGSLLQLMSELTTFDALPAAEPEPVFAAEAAITPDQDSL